MFGQEIEAERDRVLARRLGQLVDESLGRVGGVGAADRSPPQHRHADVGGVQVDGDVRHVVGQRGGALHRGMVRSEEHTSELQSLMRISYAVFCLKKKNNNKTNIYLSHRTT